MPVVKCKNCGGAHPTWECRVDERSVGYAPLSEEEKARVPWLQPKGVCPSCDKRREMNAVQMKKRRGAP